MPTRGASGAIPAAVQAWRMVAPATTRSTVTAGKSGRPAPASQATCCALSARRCWPSGAAHVGTYPGARVNRGRQPAGASGGTSSSPTDASSPNGLRRIKSPLGLRSFCDDSASHAAISAAAVFALPRSKVRHQLRPATPCQLQRRGYRTNAEFPWRRWQGCGQARRFPDATRTCSEGSGDPRCPIRTRLYHLVDLT